MFSYLNLRKPASLLWRAFSPAREPGEPEREPDPDQVPDRGLVPQHPFSEPIPRKVSGGSTSSGVSDMSGGSDSPASFSSDDINVSLSSTPLTNRLDVPRLTAGVAEQKFELCTGSAGSLVILYFLI